MTDSVMIRMRRMAIIVGIAASLLLCETSKADRTDFIVNTDGGTAEQSDPRHVSRLLRRQPCRGASMHFRWLRLVPLPHGLEPLPRAQHCRRCTRANRRASARQRRFLRADARGHRGQPMSAQTPRISALRGASASGSLGSTWGRVEVRRVFESCEYDRS